MQYYGIHRRIIGRFYPSDTRRRYGISAVKNMKSGWKILAVVAAIVCVAAAVVAVTGFADDCEHSISYELNGGINSDKNPTSYTDGSDIALYVPYRDGYEFKGWYLDSDLTAYFDGSASGDITLYAAWSETLEGRGFTLDVNGTVVNGPFNSYSISGEMSFSYLYYDNWNDRYYMNRVSDLDYTYMSGIYNNSDDKNYWSDESSGDYTVEQAENETIVTAAGSKDCEVYVLRYSDGSVETQWIGDGWIVYKITYVEKGMFSSSTITYTFREVRYFTPDVSCDVTIYTDDGIEATGGGEYNPGDSVTLTASGDGFSGWYDEYGNLLSENRSYTLSIGGSGVTVYAMNDRDVDMTFAKGGEAVIDLGYAFDSAEWTVLDEDGETICTSDLSTLTYTFPEVGRYTVLADGEVGGSERHLVRNVEVDGTKDITYSWVYSGRTYTTTLSIEYSDYRSYVDMMPVSDRCQESTHQRDRQFVTYSDPYILSLASTFEDMTSGFTQAERANFILTFVQYIEYQSDEAYMGHEEYWKYPLETLFDQGGDCEDTSILLSAIAEAMGYDTALLMFPGHMSTGIAVDGVDARYFTGEKNRYCYCETTATGYKVGEIPSGVSNCTAVVEICSGS